MKEQLTDERLVEFAQRELVIRGIDFRFPEDNTAPCSWSMSMELFVGHPGTIAIAHCTVYHSSAWAEYDPADSLGGTLKVYRRGRSDIQDYLCPIQNSPDNELWLLPQPIVLMRRDGHVGRATSIFGSDIWFNLFYPRVECWLRHRHLLEGDKLTQELLATAIRRFVGYQKKQQKLLAATFRR